MEYVVSSSVSFDAGHHTDRFEGCKFTHGHQYTVTVTLAAKIDDEAAALDMTELEAALAGIKAEFYMRDLNVMLPPMEPTLIGLASHVWQRLSMTFLQMREVRVDESTGRTITLRSS